MTDADLQEALALEEQGNTACRQGAYLEALTYYKQALASRERLQGNQSPDLVPILTSIGEILQTLARYAEAEPWYRRAFAICEAVYGPSDWQTAKTLGDVAGILDEQGRYNQARPLYEQSARIVQDAGNQFETALALAKLARFERIVGNIVQAEHLFQQALTLYLQLPGSEEHRGHLAITLNNLAFLKLEQGKFAEAEGLLRQALEINTAIKGKAHINTGINLRNLGTAYTGQGQTILGQLCYQRALTIYEQALGRDHPTTRALVEQLSAEHGSQL
jgi:tetratricopeptide (TPR) repeat protein